MKEIVHSFQFNSTPEKLFFALTTGVDISKWWTTIATLRPLKGTKGEFIWRGHEWKVNITLQKVDMYKQVVWYCDESNMQNTDAWKSTKIDFQIFKGDEGQVILDFCQSNYKDSLCHKVCSDGWRFVLGESLKSYLETGKGKPYQF